MEIINVFLEIIKITLPALIVFATVYYLMKQHSQQELQLKSMAYRQNLSNQTVPLRLQAYERLALLCERIDLPNIMLRQRTDNMSAQDLYIATMIGMQQEYEHNLSQQVYVSDDLWQIINIAKNENVAILQTLMKEIPAHADSRDLYQRLLSFLQEKPNIALEKAKLGIKKEASTMF